DRFLEDATEVDVDALCDGSSERGGSGRVWIGGIMQHVEEAGVHSGDSACVLPPHSLGEEMLEQIREATRDIALAMGGVGLLGVEMRSTGEVMGIARDFPAAFAKAQAAAGVPLPREGTAFITVTDSDKAGAFAVAQSLHDNGFRIVATRGTAEAIARMGIPVQARNKVGE